MKKVFLLSFAMFGLVASNAFAADPLVGSNSCSDASMDSVTGIITWASCLLMRSIVPFLFMLATAGFIYGLVRFFLNPDSKDKKEEGKKFIVWGLVALFVMTAMWGIVSVFTNTFDVKNTMPQLPTLSE